MKVVLVFRVCHTISSATSWGDGYTEGAYSTSARSAIRATFAETMPG